MRIIFALALVVAVSAYAVTKTEDGGLILSADEVNNTIRYIREVQAAAIINEQKVIELENEIKLLKNTRCM
jgi:hypothetical protein